MEQNTQTRNSSIQIESTYVSQRCKGNLMEKDSLFDKWCWNIWISTYLKKEP